MSIFKKTIINNQISKQDTETSLVLQGKILSELNRNKSSKNIQDYEFKVFSQNGEDGIIQFLIQNTEIKNKIFVEFGVETYKEANTKFLLLNNGWSGLIIDGDKDAMEKIASSDLHWKYDLKSIGNFITKDNINEIIKSAGIEGEIGLLSVDIDGNDYWVFENIDCVNPQILIMEYNSMFGDTHKISVPYDENFVRSQKHYSNLYYGASIAALCDIANKKGYDLVGSNSFGNNLFFIRYDCNKLKIKLTPKEAYVKSKFRESRDENGKLTFLSHKEGLELIKNEPVANIEDKKTYSIGEVFNV